MAISMPGIDDFNNGKKSWQLAQRRNKVFLKKVLHKHEEKMQEKMKMT